MSPIFTQVYLLVSFVMSSALFCLRGCFSFVFVVVILFCLGVIITYLHVLCAYVCARVYLSAHRAFYVRLGVIVKKKEKKKENKEQW